MSSEPNGAVRTIVGGPSSLSPTGRHASRRPSRAHRPPLRSTASVREESPSSRQNRENNLAAVLMGISLLFIFCQSAKIIPDLYEVIYCRWTSFSGETTTCPVTEFIQTMVSLSHLLLAVNSSANFIIYTWRGKDYIRTKS